MNVSILGAGAAGLFAALEIIINPAIEVHLFDLNPRPGRKLAVTGSGRGNLTNLNQVDQAYRSSTCANVRSSFQLLEPQYLCELFNQWGIPTVATEDGWVYPLSNSAANVAQTLTQQVIARGAILHPATKIIGITRDPGGFSLRAAEGDRYERIDALLIATGSSASQQLGADDSLLAELRKLGVASIPFQPALSGIVSGNPFKALSGLRLDVRARLVIDGMNIAEEVGNLIFTDFGVNGPAAMNLSHLIHSPIAEWKSVELSLDFLPDERADLAFDLFHAPTMRDIPVRCLWNALFPEKLTLFLLQRIKLPPDTPISKLTQQRFKHALKLAKDLRLPVAGTKSLRDAQVGFGGVRLDQVVPKTMEAKRIPGLYFAGEVLDCIGKCGGYNLHWAWSSASLAARAIRENAKKK